MDGTWTQVSIALIALGSLLVAVSSAAARPHSNPNQAVLIAGLVIAGIGVVGVLLTAALAALRSLEDRRPPLTISYDPNDEEYVQKTPSENSGIQFRVRVENTGRVALRQVRVKLRPLNQEGVHTHFLQLRHDNEIEGERSWDGENIQVGDDAFFDVFFTHPYQILLSFASKRVPSSVVRPVKLKVRLTASGWLGDGRDVPPTSRDFWIEAPQDGTTSAVMREA